MTLSRLSWTNTSFIFTEKQTKSINSVGELDPEIKKT